MKITFNFIFIIYTEPYRFLLDIRLFTVFAAMSRTTQLTNEHHLQWINFGRFFLSTTYLSITDEDDDCSSSDSCNFMCFIKITIRAAEYLQRVHLNSLVCIFWWRRRVDGYLKFRSHISHWYLFEVVLQNANQ
jgi:hypothetical protein